MNLNISMEMAFENRNSLRHIILIPRLSVPFKNDGGVDDVKDHLEYLRSRILLTTSVESNFPFQVKERRVSKARLARGSSIGFWDRFTALRCSLRASRIRSLRVRCSDWAALSTSDKNPSGNEIITLAIFTHLQQKRNKEDIICQ